VNISVVHPRELGPEELARWRLMQRQSVGLANPFLSPEFALAVGRVRPDARVALLEDGSEIVGFFPHQRGRLGIGRPIGAGLSDCQGLIHAPGLDWDPQALLRACGLAVWEFDHLMADQLPFVPYHVAHDGSPVLDLSNGYEAYLEDRLRHSRHTIRATFKKQQKLEHDIGEITFDFDVQDHYSLGVLMGWKSAQYRRTARSDRFGKSWIVRLVDDLLETRSESCTGSLSVLYAGGQAIAAHFGLRSTLVLACWFPAYDVRFAKYSPGLLLHLGLAKEAGALGLRYVDLGKGKAEYKDLMKSTDLPIAEGWVERVSTVALARHAQRAPARFVLNFILNRPHLRWRARRAREHIGRIRNRIDNICT
jgi:CelD/BcsL family acetyltransferase involved in cellulose biosynthesis